MAWRAANSSGAQLLGFRVSWARGGAGGGARTAMVWGAAQRGLGVGGLLGDEAYCFTVRVWARACHNLKILASVIYGVIHGFHPSRKPSW